MGLFQRGLSKTRTSFFGRISQLLGGAQLDDETWEDIEALLIQADVGTPTTALVVERVRERVKKQGVNTPEGAQKVLRDVLREILAPPPPLNLQGRVLSVILVVGVNGSGKTTSIAKLANHLKNTGRKVIIAAGDTFRAAAVEQLQTWGSRIDIPVISNKQNADAGAVVFDATAAARARKLDTLIIDTAGRLHNNYNLMEELTKIRFVSQKTVHQAPHEVLLVLDGTTGQNALTQAQKFKEAANVTGVIVTKLDGSAKGGMIFAIYNELKLPVYFVGLGEALEDFAPFDPDNFINSLFDKQ
ncbi:MAG: signal recognition particle-docking protein FtsY [Phototrophicaceae bacterium]